MGVSPEGQGHLVDLRYFLSWRAYSEPFPECWSDGGSQLSGWPRADLASSFRPMGNTLKWHSSVTLIELPEKKILGWIVSF